MLPVTHYITSAIVHSMPSGSNIKSEESIVDSEDPATVHFLKFCLILSNIIEDNCKVKCTYVTNKRLVMTIFLIMNKVNIVN